MTNLKKLMAVLDATGVSYRKIKENEIHIHMPACWVMRDKNNQMPEQEDWLVASPEEINVFDDDFCISVWENETGFLNWLGMSDCVSE